MADSHRTKGTSLAKGPIGIIGLILLAAGILGLLFGSTDFDANPIDGTVNGDNFLGFEGNGWTWLLIAVSGLLLLLSAPLHWGAKTMAIIVGLVLGAASVISLVDGDDVFGIFAANGPMKLALGIASAALLISALLPRVGKKDKHDDRDVVYRDRPVERERTVEPRATTPVETTRTTPVETTHTTPVETTRTTGTRSTGSTGAVSPDDDSARFRRDEETIIPETGPGATRRRP